MSATVAERWLAFKAFRKACPTGNFSDFLHEVYRGDNPKLTWDVDENAQDGHGDDSDENGDYGDDEDEAEIRRKRAKPDASAVGNASSASSSSSSSSSASSLPAVAPSATCKFTFDDYVRMSKDPGDMLQPCIEESCPARRKDHAKQTSESRFKMPGRECFPTFRDPRDKLMSDPHEFLSKLDRQLKLYSVPSDRYGVVLISCLRDRIMQEWVETNIVATCHTWEDVKLRFKLKYDDPEIKNQLMSQLENCLQRTDERVYEYTERYHALVVRISSGATVDTQMNIITCERGFVPALRAEISKFRSLKAQERQDKNFEFGTLAELYQVAATLETGLAPRTGRYRAFAAANDVRKRARDGKRRARVNQVGSTEKAERASPSVNKIEISATGKPVNVNKKHRTRKSGPVPTRSGGPSQGGHAGGNRMPDRRASTGSMGAAGSAGNAQSRGGAAAAAAATPFTGRCFKCDKVGHRAADCRAPTAVRA
jgi:hypothetical protein